jgi:hypothetical protein
MHHWGDGHVCSCAGARFNSNAKRRYRVHSKSFPIISKPRPHVPLRQSSGCSRTHADACGCCRCCQQPLRGLLEWFGFVWRTPVVVVPPPRQLANEGQLAVVVWGQARREHAVVPALGSSAHCAISVFARLFGAGRCFLRTVCRLRSCRWETCIDTRCAIVYLCNC